MTPRRFSFPGGLRGVALVIGATVLLSVFLQGLRARSAGSATLVEQVLFGLAVACALFGLVAAARQLRPAERLHPVAARAARIRLMWFASFVLILGLHLAKSLAPLWWGTSAGRVLEWCVGLSALALLLVATQPSSSGRLGGGEP